MLRSSQLVLFYFNFSQKSKIHLTVLRCSYCSSFIYCNVSCSPEWKLSVLSSSAVLSVGLWGTMENVSCVALLSLLSQFQLIWLFACLLSVVLHTCSHLWTSPKNCRYASWFVCICLHCIYVFICKIMASLRYVLSLQKEKNLSLYCKAFIIKKLLCTIVCRWVMFLLLNGF